MPEFKVYDGYWMILGALIAFAVAAPLVWRLRREISLVVITLAALVGCVAPLVILAMRRGIPIGVRLRGAWVLGGADFVGPAVVIGCLFLWFAIRKYETSPKRRVAGPDEHECSDDLPQRSSGGLGGCTRAPRPPAQHQPGRGA